MKNINWTSEKILSTLDSCCQSYNFPMLDNGYVYLAATRLSLYHSNIDWAIVIEVFGFSPRAGTPDTHIYTFASNLYNRNRPDHYGNSKAYEQYIINNPHNESRFIMPIEDNGKEWIDSENMEYILDKGEYILRGKKYNLPALEDYKEHGIQLEESKVKIFEFCRLLAATKRDKVLANKQERRISVLPEMKQILQLETWNHPDIANGELPSNNETFKEIAMILSTGNLEYYNPTQPANTDWINWLEGGSL